MEKIIRYEPAVTEGLTKEQVENRKKQKLVNYDTSVPTKSNIQIISLNIFTIFNLLNAILALAILFVGSYKNLLFMGVVFSNIFISTIQELRAKRIIDKLSVIASSKVCVLRDSKEEILPMNEVVLDDIIKYQIGNQIITDSVILKGSCEVNESFITGEASTIYKQVGDPLLSGSFIVSGTVYAKVEHIGEENYTAQISKEAKYIKKVKSEIMTSLNKILKIAGIVILPIGAILLYQQLNVVGNTPTDAVVSTVAALIGMIPEGLVLLTSTVFAVSVLRLSKYNVLVQELYSIETLARIDTLCLDKTGTITEGVMELKDCILLKDVPIQTILSNFSHAFLEENATLQAIKKAYPKSTLEEIVDVYPFSSARKYSAVTFARLGTFFLGAPEFLLKDTSKIEHYLKKYTDDYRVLLLCQSKEQDPTSLEHLEPIALLLLEDKIRKEAIQIIDYFQKQEVEIKLISGDHPKTVSSIAKRSGVKNYDKYVDLSKIQTKDYEQLVKEYTIFGRVGPQEKKELIKALKNTNHTVAMTGDGVNDVLALKEADCSIGLGNGTDAARNVSQLVLLDSNFSSVLKVVMEGRRSINNIERSASLFLVKTIFATLLALVFLFISVPYPFMPIQLTLTSTVTIGIPSLILALEPNENIVKGRFLTNVISKALPAALTITINIFLIMGLSYLFHLSKAETSTMCVISNAVVGFLLLYKISSPFNLLRKVLFISMLILFFAQSIFFHELYSLVLLSPVGFFSIAFVLVLSFGIFKNLVLLYERVVQKHPNWFQENKKVKI